MKITKQLLIKIKDKIDLKSYSEKIHFPIKNISRLKDKLNLPSVNLDPAKVRVVLEDKVDNKLCNQLVGLLITCDEGKYSPNINGKREKITDEVIELLSILDKEL